MSKLEVDAIEPQSGTALTIGASGDTITIPSGATIKNAPICSPSFKASINTLKAELWTVLTSRIKLSIFFNI